MAQNWFQHIDGDLFQVDSSISLAHCVSHDFAMGRGIALEFKKRFAGVDDLKKQGKLVGECAQLQRDKRFIFYLITKSLYWHKPTYRDLEKSLGDLKFVCEREKIYHVAIPRIGCGLDQLNFDKVCTIIQKIFADGNIKITMVSLKNLN